MRKIKQVVGFDYFKSLPLIEEIVDLDNNTEKIENKILVEQIINTLKSERMKKILHPRKWYYIDVFIDYINGITYKEMAKKYRVSMKSIEKTIKEVRKVLLKLVEG